MPAGKRAARVGDVLLREIADLLMRRVKDPRVKGVTITEIEMSGDLKHARVFFSVLGGEKEVLTALAGLESAKGFMKREIGIRMDLKYTPEITFKHDPSLDRGDHMEKLFERLRSGAGQDGSE